MTYLALARQWRPRSFDALLGQEMVSQALKNALNQQRLHHAYLFTGTRGVGKTSVARLFAKALNCEKGMSDTPCLQCESCLSIEQGRFVDLLEIDGASKTKVEDTRALLDNVQYAPSCGRFKIYLIDEVHMLSQHSFNALLKTLEEPPAHVKFLLATTDPQKIPATIVSRCLQFHLRPLTSEVIQAHLNKVSSEAGFDAEPEALQLLASPAKGSMRDALSLLEQVLACSKEKVVCQTVKALLGYTQENYSTALLEALVAQKGSTLMTLSQQIAQEGGHYPYVLETLLHQLYALAKLQQLPEMAPAYGAPLNALAQALAPETVQLWYQIVLKSQEDLALAPDAQLGFEMVLLRLLAFQPGALAEKTWSPPASTAGVEAVQKVQTPPPTSAPAPAPLPQEPEERVSSPAPTPASFVSSNWAELIQQLKLSGMTLAAAEHASVAEHTDKQLTLQVTRAHQSLFTPNVIKQLEKALLRHYGHAVKVKLECSATASPSPAEEKKQAQAASKAEASQALQADPVLQSIQVQFDAVLVEDSVEPTTSS